MSEIIAPVVRSGAEEMGIHLPAAAGDAFETYYELLEQRGANTNLTAIKGAEDVANLHFLDSLALLKAATFVGASLIDIGSGAGFPGVPIKIAEPSTRLTILDSASKRIAFLTELCADLDIEADIVNARAEIAAHNQQRREKYDIAVSRAVAQLNILCELCLPFVAVGGLFIAMKGPDSVNEVAGAGDAAGALGAQIADVFNYAIPRTGIIHSAVLFRKTSETPGIYPRRFARIKSAPL